MSLLVKTFIKESTMPGAGMGCFSSQFIPKGTKIWELNTALDRIYTQQDFDRLSDLEKAFVSTYAYKHHNLYFLCVDNARFFNHSVERCNTLDPSDVYCTFAARDIDAGEEIISNYYEFGCTEGDSQFNAIL